MDVHSSAVIEYRDVPHPDHKFSHLEMLILAACGLAKSAGAAILVFSNILCIKFVTVDVRSSAVIEYRDVLHPGHKFPHLEMLIFVACGLAKSAGAVKNDISVLLLFQFTFNYFPCFVQPVLYSREWQIQFRGNLIVAHSLNPQFNYILYLAWHFLYELL